MERADRLGAVVETERTNAIFAWALIAFTALTAGANAVTGDYLWAGFASAVLALVLVPTVAFRRVTAMLPWEVLAMAILPLLGRTFATVPLTTRFATYLAVAALALIVAVELHVFTPVRMTPGFAVLFVVMTTLAAAGAWAVVRWASDILLGTTVLLKPGVPEKTIETGLMWEFVYSTAAGVVAGVLFQSYFRRRARLRERYADAPEVYDP